MPCCGPYNYKASPRTPRACAFSVSRYNIAVYLIKGKMESFPLMRQTDRQTGRHARTHARTHARRHARTQAGRHLVATRAWRVCGAAEGQTQGLLLLTAQARVGSSQCGLADMYAYTYVPGHTLACTQHRVHGTTKELGGGGRENPSSSCLALSLDGSWAHISLATDVSSSLSSLPSSPSFPLPLPALCHKRIS